MDAGNSGLVSLVLATDIDVLPLDREVVRRDGYTAVRSPSNPRHHWGNMLIYDGPPRPGDRARWLETYAAEFPHLHHVALTWDISDAGFGAAREEFPDCELFTDIGLVATPAEVVPHPRADRRVTVRLLGDDTDPGWAEVIALQVAQNAAAEDPYPDAPHTAFLQGQQDGLRSLFALGRGGWFVAEEDGRVVGSLGVVITGGRARYRSVDVAPAFRGRGIASRLVVEAAALSASRWPVVSLVIAADVEYHALGIYESLGFRPIERVHGVYRRPPAD